MALAPAGAAIAESSARVDKIIVGATKTPHTLGDVPVAADVVTREELQERNVRTVQEALENVTGMAVEAVASMYNERGGLVSMQGLEPRHTLILIDGQRLQGGHQNAIDMQQISIEMIERIEIVKGPASALYGSEAMGGVINIVTRDAPKKPEFSGSLGIGTRGTMIGRVSAGTGNEHVGAHVNYTYGETEGINKDNDPFQEHILQGTFSINLAERAKLKVKPYYSIHEATALDPEVTQERYGGSTLLTWEPDELSSIKLRGSYFSYHNLAEDESTDTILSNTEFEATFSRLLFSTHLVTAGYQYWLDDRDSESQQLFLNQDTHSIYLQDEIDLSPVVFVLGGRLDFHDLWGEEFNPRASLMYKANDKLTFRASVGTAFKAPSLLKLYGFTHPGSITMYAIGNPDLKPEKSVGYQAGIDYQICKGASANVSVFRNDIEDLIDTKVQFFPPGPPWLWQYGEMTFSNVEEAMTQGVEVNLRSCVTNNITARLGYTYLDTENKLTGMELTYRPNHKLAAGVHVDIPDFGARLDFETFYTGERWEDDDNTMKLDDFWIFSASAAKEVGEHAEVFVKVDNVFNEKNIEDDYNIDGREFFAGVKLNF